VALQRDLGAAGFVDCDEPTPGRGLERLLDALLVDEAARADADGVGDPNKIADRARPEALRGAVQRVVRDEDDRRPGSAGNTPS
jgi:hypothetical protein